MVTNIIASTGAVPNAEQKATLVAPRACSEADAARYTNISVSELRKQRMQGRRARHMPPVPFVRIGRRIIYLFEDLDRWLEMHRVSFDEPSYKESIDGLTSGSKPGCVTLAKQDRVA